MSELTPGPAWARIAGRFVVGLTAAWSLGTLALVLVHLGVGGVERFQIASASFGFVLTGALIRLVVTNRLPLPPYREPGPKTSLVQPGRVPVVVLFVYLGAAALLYLSAWRLGWLSDDFGHVTRANQWSFGFVTPSFFRPLPLFAWAVLFSAGFGAVSTHALNIVLHATNAWLVRACSTAGFRGIADSRGSPAACSSAPHLPSKPWPGAPACSTSPRRC